MKKMSKELLVEDDIKKWKDAYAIIAVLEEKILNRMDYIVRTIFSTFNTKVSYWVAYSEDGSLNNSIGTYTISYYEIDFEKSNRIRDYLNENEPVIFLKDGTEFGFNDHEFPKRWLFEDFEQELIDGKAAFLKAKEFKDKIEKEHLVIQKLEYEELIKAAKSKLSKEEYDALKKTCCPNR